jgi:hypothetical protein
MTMKPCQFHQSAAIDAELMVPTSAGVTYRRLVCCECGLVRGLRFVRRASTTDELREFSLV